MKAIKENWKLVLIVAAGIVALHFMKTAPLKKLLIIWKAIGNYGYSG